MSETLLNASHAADRLGVTRPTLKTFEKLRDEEDKPLLTNLGGHGNPQYEAAEVEALAERLAKERAKALAAFGERTEAVFKAMTEVKRRAKNNKRLMPLVTELCELLRDGRISLVLRAKVSSYFCDKLPTWKDREKFVANFGEAVEACRERLIPHSRPLPSDEEEAWYLELAKRLAGDSGDEPLAARLASMQERLLAGPPPQLVRDAIETQKQTVRDEVERALDLKRHLN